MTLARFAECSEKFATLMLYVVLFARIQSVAFRTSDDGRLPWSFMTSSERMLAFGAAPA